MTYSPPASVAATRYETRAVGSGNHPPQAAPQAAPSQGAASSCGKPRCCALIGATHSTRLPARSLRQGRKREPGCNSTADYERAWVQGPRGVPAARSPGGRAHVTALSRRVRALRPRRSDYSQRPRSTAGCDRARKGPLASSIGPQSTHPAGVNEAKTYVV